MTDHFVVIEDLPKEFRIPPQLLGRLEYDAAAKKLVYHGFMSKTDYDALVAVTSDWSFIRKLEALFQKCTLQSQQERRGLLRFLSSKS